MSVYAVTDLHGRLDLWKQIKAFVKPEDTIYFLGDAVDRGPDSWELLNTLLNDPQVIFIKGNHEWMLEDAIRDYLRTDGMNVYESTYNLRMNGDMNTFHTWMYETREDTKILGVLRNLPLVKEYVNQDGLRIWLSHSGCPPIKNRWSGEYGIPERLALWDREHIWKNESWECPENMICVHGHTPIPFFFAGENIDIEIEPGALWYCNDHKVCIDTGAWASGYTVLLDLDTFDEHIFYDEELTRLLEQENQ